MRRWFRRSARQPGPAEDERLGSRASADWMVAPTLAEAGTELRIVGTSHYQPAITALAGGRDEAGPANDLVTAELVIEQDGPYAGAVRVLAGGRQVGSIDQGRAEEYRAVVETLAATGRTAICRAVIYGSHYADDSDGWRNLGFALLQPGHPAPAPEDAPFLPPVLGVQVLASIEVCRQLDASTKSRAKRHVRRCTGLLDPDGWRLQIDGEVVGPLAGYHVHDDHPDLRLIRAAADAGHPLTCSVRLIRERDRPLRVMTDLPVSLHPDRNPADH